MVLYDLCASRFLGPSHGARQVPNVATTSHRVLTPLFFPHFWPIEEATFCSVLDEFAAVEIREGR
ncbi:hypothetical protein BS47DRAFT_1348564 [Hydnum rufescens UP504]|uniref:Uncharacterized protein n=1 Tax=Hydnum rufescens UP504 TaxID=1448309 RepID=A0A9P6AQC8_9AGAM|nr:hypothetical protein BS47DRAFT_1348564 [Hydnum rufescens UP504]